MSSIQVSQIVYGTCLYFFKKKFIVTQLQLYAEHAYT